jgi:hypothetical protein
VNGFLSGVATDKRMDLGQAVEGFIMGRAPKTQSATGKRPQLSAGYHYIVSMWLREFARTFLDTDVCDLKCLSHESAVDSAGGELFHLPSGEMFAFLSDLRGTAGSADRVSSLVLIGLEQTMRDTTRGCGEATKQA